VGAQPQQVAGNPIQLGHDDADVLGARRRGHAEELSRWFRKTRGSWKPRDVIHAVERRDELAVGLRFAQLLHTAMQVTDHAFRVQNALTVQLELHLKHAVRRRVLRPHAAVISLVSNNVSLVDIDEITNRWV